MTLREKDYICFVKIRKGNFAYVDKASIYTLGFPNPEVEHGIISTEKKIWL